MKSNPEKVCIKELVLLNKRGITPKYVEDDGIVVINQKCIRDFVVNPEQARLTSKTKKIPDEKFLTSYDVLVNSTGVGTLGRVAQIKEVMKLATVDSHITILRPDKNKVDPIYFGYIIKNAQRRIEALAEGSTGQTELSRILLGELKVDFYSNLKIQKKIAHILGALDDKIELGRKMNQTLEAMAQALFKSWFVDFDPVHAKAGCKSDAELERGARELGISKEVLELFPSEFEESELGMIPKGWEIETIGDNFELLGGFAFKSSQYNDEGEYGLVTIKNVQDGKFIEECANHIADIPNKIKTHCILKSGDILLSLTGNVGRVCIVSKGKYLLNQRVSKLISKKDLPLSYPYFYFRSSQVYKSMLGIAKGTAQLNLSPIETAKLKMIKPNVNILNSVKDIFNNLFSQIVDNNNQVQTLQQTRDTLLPKLLSGELDVSEIEIEGL